MSHRKSCIATDLLLAAAALCLATGALAAPAGVVTQTSGPLFMQNGQGRIKALSADSEVSPGEMVVTGRETFAQVRFADGGIVTLGPDTRISIDAYRFEPSNPAMDRSQITFTQGALQVSPGELAGRSPDRQILSTPSGDIKSGASSFVVHYVGGEVSNVAAAEPIRLASLSLTLSDAIVVAQNVPGAPGSGLAPGLYVSVIDGAINLSNKGGSTNFQAGQFGYTANINKAPVIVPANPGLQFTPPPSFSSTSGTQGNTGSGKSNAVDCEVR